jgi:hypothetical protein
MADKLKAFLKLHEAKIALILGFILVAVISFEFGLIQGKNRQDKPLIVEKPALSQNVTAEASSGTPVQAQNSTAEAKMASGDINAQPVNCAFVGSKNSNKYHLPTCHFAKLIKPENILCFKSAEDAVNRGYQPDKTCLK